MTHEERARAIADRGVDVYLVRDIIAAIRAAVFDETEACAKVADKCANAKEVRPPKALRIQLGFTPEATQAGWEPAPLAYNAAGRTVAAAIRQRNK